MAHFLSQSWLLKRREVLRGLGASLALPLLDCMRPLRAAENVARPRRSVFIYLPNGVNTNDFEMAKVMSFREFSSRWRSIGEASHRSVGSIIPTPSASLTARPRPGSPAPSTDPRTATRSPSTS